MKAVQKFKTLVESRRRRPGALAGALGKGLQAFHHTGSTDGESDFAKLKNKLHRSRSTDLADRAHAETALATEGVHLRDTTREISSSPIQGKADGSQANDEVPTHARHSLDSGDASSFHPPKLAKEDSGEKGHAHNPLDEQPLFLGIGPGGQDFLEAPPQDIIAESPTAAEFNIYDTAYQQEVERIRAAQGHTATVYLTRRVDEKKEYKADENMIEVPKAGDDVGGAREGFKGLLDKAREKKVEPEEKKAGGGNRFSELASKAMENTRLKGRELGDMGGGVLDNVLAKAVEKRNEQKEKREQKELREREAR